MGGNDQVKTDIVDIRAAGIPKIDDNKASYITDDGIKQLIYRKQEEIYSLYQKAKSEGKIVDSANYSNDFKALKSFLIDVDEQMVHRISYPILRILFGDENIVDRQLVEIRYTTSKLGGNVDVFDSGGKGSSKILRTGNYSSDSDQNDQKAAFVIPMMLAMITSLIGIYFFYVLFG